MKFLPRRAPGASTQISVIIGVKNGAATLQRCLDRKILQVFFSSIGRAAPYLIVSPRRRKLRPGRA